jgi:phospholipase/carboxylesterase
LTQLHYSERPAVQTARGLLVLHHGRGTDEHDLLGLADALDPAHSFHIVAPRAPLRLPGSPGYHWYVVPRAGFPDPQTFDAAYRALADLHDALWVRTGISPEATILGGFSMGSVMSYALGLGRDRPGPAGVMAFSGFIPTVETWEPAFNGREHTTAFVAHGRNDPVIDVSFAHTARGTLEAGGLEVEYHESGVGHYIDPAHVRAAATWLARTVRSAS